MSLYPQSNERVNLLEAPSVGTRRVARSLPEPPETEYVSALCASSSIVVCHPTLLGEESTSLTESKGHRRDGVMELVCEGFHGGSRCLSSFWRTMERAEAKVTSPCKPASSVYPGVRELEGSSVPMSCTPHGLLATCRKNCLLT